MPPTTPTRLYDHAGRPVRPGALRQGAIRPGQASGRGLWHQSFYRHINPSYMAWVLYEARNGADLDRFLSLAEEFEEIDPHYAGVLRARKRATTKLPLEADPNGAKADIAEACDKLVNEPLVRSALTDVLDGLGKGFSLTEIMWRSAASGWEPYQLKWRDPRHFRFSPKDRMTIELRTGADEPQPLQPFKWLYHVPKLKSGLPSRNGLARLCAWTWLYKSYTVKDWMNFLQTYGIPMRIGKYKPGADQADIDTLIEQIFELGQDAAAVIPDTMLIEFAEVKSASGNASVFEGAARYFDEALSKAIVGATMTADSGSSLAQAKVHMEVQHDITEGDAADLATTLSEQLLQPWVQLNYGPQERYPLAKFVLPARPGENVDDPDAPAGDGKGGDGKKPAGDGSMNAADVRAMRRLFVALNAVGDGVGDQLDDLAGEYLADWKPQVAPLREDLEALLSQANTLEEAQARLPGLLRSWGERDHRFIDALGEAGFKASGIGASE